MTTTTQDQAFSGRIGRVIDNTAQKDYMNCPSKYVKGMVWHRRGSGPPTPPLNYGSCWHTTLETSYAAPQLPWDDLFDHVRAAVIRRWEESTKLDDHRTLDRLLLEYRKYIAHYGLPWDEPDKTVGWPDAPLVELAVDVPIPGARHPYAGKLDRIVKTRSGQYIIEDHKTTATLRSDYFKQWTIDNQMIGYAAIASIITGLPISGVRINLHVVHKSDSVFERQTIPFSKPRIESWYRNYDQWLDRLERSMELHEQAEELYTHEGWSPEYERLHLEAWPQNFTACAGKYSMCQYYDICTLPPHLREEALAANFIVAPWDPLAVEGDLDA